ncbi:MAG: hypothetical protein NC411_01595 [Bacteroides sp.]|nr:hypothetical protein [Bacteroides sp.]
MYNQLKNVFNSRVSEYSMMLIVCCLLGNALSLSYSNEWTAIAVAFSLLGGVVLASWLIWGSYVLILKKKLKALTNQQRVWVETFSLVLMLIWVYIVSESLTFVIPWALLFGWYVYRLIKVSKENACGMGE